MMGVRFFISVLMLALTPGVCVAQAQSHAVCGVDLNGMDSTVRPGDDFYAYANGNWIRQTPIPGTLARLSASVALDDKVREQTRDLILEVSSNAGSLSSANRKIVDFYETFMDVQAIEARGLAPLRPILDRIASISDPTALARALGETLRADVDPLNAIYFHTDHLFGLWVAQDFHDPKRYLPYLLQGGTGLSNPDDYSSDDPRKKRLRQAYQAHVAAVLRLAGFPEADLDAERILALERGIASAHESLEHSQDVHNGYNVWSRSDFVSRAPGLDWNAYFEGAGLNADRVVVWQPRAAIREAALVASVPLASWKAYLAYHAIDEASAVLPSAFYDERFAFYGTVLTGARKQRERWERAVNAINSALGFAVGRLYAARYFPPASKLSVERMVENLRGVFAQRLRGLTWMTDGTKAAALEKLRMMRVGVGYPERERDYSGLLIERGDAFGNWRRAELFAYRKSVDKLGQPVDRDEWWVTPQTVNALQLPLQNALNFPAAFLQPPYFDPQASAAHNYGWLGATIGHEISHGFDSTGAEFDAEGRLRNWWTASDRDRFQASTQRLVDQFNRYEPFPGLHVDGKQTQAENIADAAGLSVAYTAWKQSTDGVATPGCQEGLSGDQQFFIAYAQRFRSKMTDEWALQQIETGEHAPDEYRADTVRNLDAWYGAFDVDQTRRLFLPTEQRAPVWGQ